MIRYCIRCNPGTGRWVMYWLGRRYAGQQRCWQIIGSADTLAHAVEAVGE